VKRASTDKVFWIAAAAVMCLCAPTVLGVPFALLGLLVGTFVASRAGFRSSVGVALLVTMALAAGTVAHVARRSIESKSRYPFAVRR
jgi:hypothetical protein